MCVRNRDVFFVICFLCLMLFTELGYANVVKNETVPIKTIPVNTLDKIVAVVNRGVITSMQLDSKVAIVLNGMKVDKAGGSKGSGSVSSAFASSAVDEKVVRNRVLEQLILEKIQLDLANKSGIKATDLEVVTAINSIVKNQNMNLDAFKLHLQNQGMTFDEFREQIRHEIILQKLKQRDVDNRAIVNDDEVNRVLLSEAYLHRIDYNLSYIVINIPEQATQDIVAQKNILGDKALSELKANVPFAQVSIKYSNAPNALSGGNIGWKSNIALPAFIAKSLAGLNKGAITNVIRTPMGLFIFKINDLRGQGIPLVVKEYHVRHILIKVNEITSEDEAYQKIVHIKNLLDLDKNNTTLLDRDFVKYAKEDSEDGSSVNGGDLGWVTLGDMVYPFEQAMIKLPLNQVSMPVRSPFGWHLIEVLAMRDSNLATDRQKAQIKQDLREAKIALIYDEWLRDIRDMAYVKINDN